MNSAGPKFWSWLKQIHITGGALAVDLRSKRFPNHIVMIECAILVVKDCILGQVKVIQRVMAFVHNNQVPILHHSWLAIIPLLDEVHFMLFIVFWCASLTAHL